MLMLMAPENNSNNQDHGSEGSVIAPQPTEPEVPQPVIPPPPVPTLEGAAGVPPERLATKAPETVPEAATAGTPPLQEVPTKPPASPSKEPFFAKNKKRLLVVLVVLLLAGALAGAFFLGRSHERVIVKAPPTQPINLPPQVTPYNKCVPGRGTQYIIPKDIPQGPIYDVENGKVIALEYNLNVAQLEAKPDIFSNDILDLTRNYPVDHLYIAPAAPTPGQTAGNIHLTVFVVSKAVANSITCSSTKNS